MKIITYGDELLRNKSLPVEEFNPQLANHIFGMFDIMKKARGIGLAAVQVGILQRFFITEVTDDKQRIFINPEIIQTSMEQDVYEEGCLSIPGINYDVRRPYGVVIQAWNERGKPFTFTAEGLLARVIQHEYDHLEGRLFIDRIEKSQRNKLIDEYLNLKDNRN